MQQVIASLSGQFHFLDLPDPDEWIMPGVQWGRCEHPLTPAFWVSQAWMSEDVERGGFRLGRSLAEEVVACLLGGHGAPAEIGLAAFRRVCKELRRNDSDTLPAHVLEKILLEPLTLNGRLVRYRFARQRAKYLAGALEGLRYIDEAMFDDVALREALCRLPGIGPKTASWIVRNRRASDQVAILDVHIVRACGLMGLFPEKANPAQHYRDLEQRFLAFCSRTNTRASVLDAVIWGTMRNISGRLMRLLVDGTISTVENHSPHKAGDGKCLAAVVHGAIGPTKEDREGERLQVEAVQEGLGHLVPIPA